MIMHRPKRIGMSEVIGRILPILKRYRVKRAAIFGSFARGETKEGSDIDLLIEFEGESSLLDLVSLKLDLEEALGRNVDVVTYNALHSSLKNLILREQVVIWEGT